MPLTNDVKDNFNRIVKKIRISVTDRCNMRCVYCMPYDNDDWLNQNSILHFDDIIRLVKIFSCLGIENIKITGGEPLLRPNLPDLIKNLTNIPRIQSVSMTTNGLLLRDKIQELKDSGLQSINISLDTFKPTRFKSMSGINGLHKVLESIKMTRLCGLPVKLNVVVIRGWNDDEILDFVDFSRNTGCIVKFIEFMPLDSTGIWSNNLVVSKKEMIEIINTQKQKLFPLKNNPSDPARLYSFEDGKGIIGFIPSITEPFCENCDRIRMTSDGKLYTCLFDSTNYDLKKLIKDGKTDAEIADYIKLCGQEKSEGIIKIIRTHSLKPSLNVMHNIGG